MKELFYAGIFLALLSLCMLGALNVGQEKIIPELVDQIQNWVLTFIG